MALTESNMLSLGTPAPDFALVNVVDGFIVRRDDFVDRPLLVMFICNHCPYVKHVQPELVRIGNDFADTPLAIVAIQSNDVEQYPDDGPDQMKREAEQAGYRFPYLFDETQEVAASYSAACTPDFFLFDSNHRLAYRGQLDNSRPTKIRSGEYSSDEAQLNGADLRAAIDAVLAGQPPNPIQLPSIGCNIKWRR